LRRLASALAALVVLLGSGCGHDSRYYVDSGNKLVAEGKDKDAALNFEKAIQRDGNNGEAWYRLGLVRIRLRLRVEALEALSRATELLPDRNDVTITAADFMLESYVTDRNRPRVLHDRIAALADRLFAKDAYSFDSARLKGHLASIDGNFKDAIALYRQADRAKPMQRDVVDAWIDALFQDDQPAGAETLALQMIGKDKADLGAYDILYRYYNRAGRTADAEKILKTKVENNPVDARGILELAALYAARNRDTEMKAALRGMLDRPQAFSNAHLQVGDFYAGFQRWNDALEQYDAGVKSSPRQRVVYLKRTADVLLAEGKRDQASQVVAQILKDQPADDGARALDASLLALTGNADNIAKAVVTLQSLADKNPEQPDLHFKLARALEAKGDPNGARIQFMEAIRRGPNSLAPRIALADLTQAMGDYRATLQYADEILRIAPNLTRVRLLRVVSLMQTGNDSQARGELTAIERTASGDPEVQLQIAEMDLHDKKLRDAEARFRKLLSAAPGDGRALAGLVQTLIADRRTDQALAFLQDLVNKTPNAGAARGLLARTAAQSGNLDLAIDQYRQILALSPNSFAAALDLGNVYQLKGDYPDAILFYQKAGAQAPAQAAPRALLGGVLAESGRKPEALESYRRALKLDPNNAAMLNAAAYLVAETGGDLDEALRLVQKAIQADSHQPSYTDTLGWVYCRKRMNESAVHIYRDLTAKYPDNATFHYHFAIALSQQGDTAAARSELKTALSGKTNGEMHRDIESALARLG